ncbi:MAG: ABC transporter permease [Anaerolineales bacterium]|nr:ABC transporter permease [Anaerolineales bacterium]
MRPTRSDPFSSPGLLPGRLNWPGKSLVFTLAFGAAGSLLVLFVLLPLVSTLLAVTPSALIQVLTDPQVQASLRLTFGAAAAATGLAALGGIPLAYILARRRFPGKRLVEAIVDLPVVIPHTAAGIALLMVFGSRGLLGKPLAGIGLYFTNNALGVIIAMLFVSLPYLVNLSREAFGLVDEELERIALVEGATEWQAFTQVTLPLAWRGVFSGALMMWARGISEFGAVVILAYHPKIIPVLIYERFQGFGLSVALPVAALLIFTALAVFTLLRLVLLPEIKD